ncbi:ubiquitin thioesterase OTUB1 [Verticillium alfalfae VaMs.102]|uniref:ubiquitinyl hydrolase 1 n=1 Tax=Verticillium alfalfae (strain VaMs.102 / ATCC MYA-4576 / FGSC 10136) TaxID=526221 RepID=C9S9Y9_VERA1|nr:ubiquitin thioesterase OTUB1 [Verticillium alfalfae VaMs.102]EEY16202.1 ubiquitin thioesterase OTUB1 [Verticillium alfalfae VaMs.102]
MAGSRYDQHQQHTSLLPVLFSSSASHGAGAPAHSPASAPTTAPAATALALAPTLAPASVSVSASASAAAAAAAATSGQSQEPHGPLHLPHRPQQQQVHPLQRLPQRLHQQHPGHSLGLSHQHPHPHSHAHQTHQQLQLHLLQQQHNHNQQHPSLAPYTSSYQRNRTQTQAQVQTHSQTDHQHKLAANPGYNIPSPAASAASSCSNSNNPPSTLSSYNPNSNAHAVATPASSTTSASAPNSASVRALSADMAGDSSADAAFHDDLAAQQRAAESYQPDLQTYSHYRPVQGDGNCGWRAIGFSYFEHLVFAGDPDKMSQELARLTSLNNYIANVGGYDFELFEDMVHETLSLIKDLADVVTDSATAMALLMTRFNDAQCSNAIVYHLRLLAGSWLKGNSNDFEPFLVGSGGLLQWCNENIEVPDREIDHIGITLLANILLKPIGFVLEITYLDRTPGSQANVYRLPEEATGQDPANLGPIIYLLYRPAHYDILYHKMSSRFPNPAAVPLHSELQRTVAMLPGFSGPPSAMSSLASPTAVSPMHNAYDPSPQTPWLSAPFSDSAMQQTAPPAPSAALGLLRTQPRQPPPSSTTGSQAAPSKPSQPVDYQLRVQLPMFPPEELSHRADVDALSEWLYGTKLYYDHVQEQPLQ